MVTMKLEKNFEFMQDVHRLGEKFKVFSPDFNALNYANAHCLSPFRPLERLAPLQMVLTDHPYEGIDLRQMNNAPWWYRVRFQVPADAPKHCKLTVGAADYYADVYLNGVKLGSHEGYFASFSFQADEAVKRGEENTLVIKVDSPWDEEASDGAVPLRCWDHIRNMMKGTYEHADCFVNRDVNPVGLTRGVTVDFYEDDYIEAVRTEATLDGNTGRLQVKLDMQGEAKNVRARLLDTRDLSCVAEGQGEAEFTWTVENVRKWTTPERGECGLYRLVIERMEGEESVQKIEKNIGFRTIELRRTPERTEYYLNGERLFIRGTTYFPELYISSIPDERYRRDMLLLRQAGINAVRIHVHTENAALYDLCDEMGMLLVQDTDLNWVQTRSDAFTARALGIFHEMIDLLGHHPCLCTWILFNEPDRAHDDYYMNVQPGPQLEAMAHTLTPNIPTIRGSYVMEATHSGDSHNYIGSLWDPPTHYLQKHDLIEKLNTEFGFDAPACEKDLARMPKILRALNMDQQGIDKLDEYQYRLTKYYIEDYRIQKYNVCAGYFQFLFSDPAPQSFLGCIDWWGTPKGGFRAMLESNQMQCAILEHNTTAIALWAVNDSPVAYDGAVLEAVVTDANGKKVVSERYTVNLPADGEAVRAADFTHDLTGMTVTLELRTADGKLLNRNRYVNPLQHPAHPAGHPNKMNNDIGMHVYD